MTKQEIAWKDIIGTQDNTQAHRGTPETPDRKITVGKLHIQGETRHRKRTLYGHETPNKKMPLHKAQSRHTRDKKTPHENALGTHYVVNKHMKEHIL